MATVLSSATGEVSEYLKTALELACRSGNVSFVKELFSTPQYEMALRQYPLMKEKEKEGNPDNGEEGAIPGNSRQSVLEIASTAGHLEVVKFLVQQKGYLEQFGEEALFQACVHGHADVLAFLVKQPGIDVNGFFQPPPSDNACYGFRGIYCLSLLQWACLHGDLECVKVLISAGAKLDQTLVQRFSHDTNLIGCAIEGKNPAVIQYLLDRGLPPCVTNTDKSYKKHPEQDYTITHILICDFAICPGLSSILQLLLLSGAHQCDDTSDLLNSLSCEDPAMFGTLIQFGCDPTPLLASFESDMRAQMLDMTDEQWCETVHRQFGQLYRPIVLCTLRRVLCNYRQEQTETDTLFIQ